ncbi:MAG: DUF2207 domain-containing protein, partial [Candidatus Omnitrophica bacterium]|nr:DUF2207 domain-containing protein [Candidatus Omnitrophota bacterium]
MKRFGSTLAFFIGFLLPSFAYGWEIASFETRVAIHRNATATVTETIVADFDGESRHGLFRDIPIHYTDRAGQHFRLRLRVTSVTDQAGRPWPYRLESAGRYQRVRIGDPDRYITGEQTYRIVYQVERGAIRFFPDHDECYWNLTGNEWAVPMRQVHAEISLPAAAKQLRAIAFIGPYGSTEQLQQIRTTSTQVILDPPRPLGSYEGLTAVVGWEKGLVHSPSPAQVFSWWIRDNWVYGIPLAILGFMTWLWWVRGRDPQTGESIVVQYEPPDGLTPAEMGTLLDYKAGLQDVTATLIDLAVRGYLTIEVASTRWWNRDYRFTRRKDFWDDPALALHERKMLKGIFGSGNAAGYDTRLLSELEMKFYDTFAEVRSSIYDALIAKKYFDGDPNTIRTLYLLGAAGVGVGVWILLMLYRTSRGESVFLPEFIAAGLSWLAMTLFAVVMPRRTLKGAKILNKVIGLREFLYRADQDRVRRMNDPSLFERCLAYAMVFGVAHQWARAFEGLYTQPPTWYVGDWQTFSPTQLSHDLTRATSSMGQTFTSAPRS